MRITTISLRNYRVFRSLDLELPPGLVGIYGANGAGKSSLLESILWALYGRARTSKGEIATSGATGECVVEIGFEHEDHHYLVRRSISGVNATVKTRVHLGDQVVADGISDVAAYLRSTLGMDERAFRSSVFAEQKQLAAFSDHTPEQRRRLVLQLLGITPVEKARDRARSDFRSRQSEHSRVQAILGPDVDRRAVLDTAERELAAADQQLARATSVLALARKEAELAERSQNELAEAFQRDRHIRELGGAARKRRDEAQEAIARLQRELASLEEADDELAALAAEPRVDLDDTQRLLELLVALRAAEANVDSIGEPPAEVSTDSAALQQARSALDSASAELAGAEASVAALSASLDERAAALARAAQLDDGDPCPMCGQDLVQGAHEVVAHRETEQRLAQEALTGAGERLGVARRSRQEAQVAAARLETEWESARTQSERRSAHLERRDAALAEVRRLRQLAGARDPSEMASLRAQSEDQRKRDGRRSVLLERVSRVDSARRELADQLVRLDAAEGERSTLRAELASLGFDADAHERTRRRVEQARRDLDAADSASTIAQRAAATAAQRVVGAREEALRAEQQDTALRELAEQARYLGRTADLLQGFRHVLVGSVGPQLTLHASELFNELTNNDYDGLVIDPETYEIQVLDRGVAYPSERFSGSEVDLANLALRVAISEQVRFQAGGQVGLLVLDEALASLDADRKDRILAALTRLSGRFRQILVVTHAPEVKERLPQAIEVRSVGGRQSTAHVVDVGVQGF